MTQDAFQQNEQKKRADSAGVVLQRMQQDRQQKAPPAQVQELTPAEAEKESGNAAYKKGEYKKVNMLPTFIKWWDVDKRFNHHKPTAQQCKPCQLKLCNPLPLQAIEHYTKAIELKSTLASAFNNRAMAHLKLGQVSEAQADCNSVLLLQPGNVKALLRRASARYVFFTCTDDLLLSICKASFTNSSVSP